ncbi:MAG: hypothetical protein M3320_06965, partial [Actinomycetota bacterium]|nr:hypothetical protein [Actinomycetota bacterium]
VSPRKLIRRVAVRGSVRRLAFRARKRGWHEVDPVEFATRGAPLGGVVGLAALIFRWGGLH